MRNPVKELRETLGWTQVNFAKHLGISYSSVQGYEAGRRVPPDIVEKLKSLAAKYGLADIGLLLSSDAWQAVREFHPGEVIISQARAKRTPAATARLNPTDWHALLDQVFASGNPEAIAAVQSNLVVFANYVRDKRSQRKSKKAG